MLVTGSELLVKCLETLGVDYVFGIPGAKIDGVFDALLDSSIRLVVCRHEQNAAFIAAAYGRLTGKPGVVLVTSGPGVGNLVTGLLTATTEGDPVIAIGGNVPLAMSLKQSHQATNNVKLLEGVTKRSVDVLLAETIPEVLENAFRVALSPPSGAYFISVPQDVLSARVDKKPIKSRAVLCFGHTTTAYLDKAAAAINDAKMPVLLLGLEASRVENTKAIRQLLIKTPIAVVSTYQAAGVISNDLLHCFAGRVGLFKNQPADKLLDEADVVITIGYNPVEYDPETWNNNSNKQIIHIDYHGCDVHAAYTPYIELLGEITLNVEQISQRLMVKKQALSNQKLQAIQQRLLMKIDAGKTRQGYPIHPLRFIYELRQAVDDETTICCDIGSVYIWMPRYFISYRPHQLLFSNGQQTLGVALPWAIACNYARKGKPVVSISGDGGFLFSAMELETAVREKLHFIHFIWRDGSYNMVLEQERLKYQRQSGVTIGAITIPDFAHAFGAIGWNLEDADDFQSMYKEALSVSKPVLIDVAIDYRDNPELFTLTNPYEGH